MYPVFVYGTPFVAQERFYSIGERHSEKLFAKKQQVTKLIRKDFDFGEYLPFLLLLLQLIDQFKLQKRFGFHNEHVFPNEIFPNLYSRTKGNTQAQFLS